MFLAEVGGAEVIESFGEVGTEGEGAFVVHPGLGDGGEMMPGDTDLVESGSVVGSAAVGVDGFDEFSAGEVEVAGGFRRDGGRGDGGRRGLRDGVANGSEQEKGNCEEKRNQPSIAHGGHLREPGPVRR